MKNEKLKKIMTKKNLLMVISTVVTVSIILTTQIFATVITGKFYLAAGKQYAYMGVKTTNADYFTVGVPYVSPYSDFSIDENYERIQVGMRDSDGDVILKPRIIYESVTDLRTLSYSDNINLSVGDKFAITLNGNNPELSAYAQVYMNWR